MVVHGDILQVVGNTPLVGLDRIAEGLPGRIAAKLEFMNPGGSVKDRIGEAMVIAAEEKGDLKPGGTIVEPTSGNTGVGLALAAALRGYRCIFVMPDKMSREKISLLRAFGADVVVCPTDVAPDSPRSYYSVANRLTEETAGAVQPNQYFNMANPEAHYRTTGPEIWEQTEGKISAFVAGVGTGGTISGVGKYLKEQNPDVMIVGADAQGSIYTQPDDIHPYLTEGIGEDFWPETLDKDLVDRWEKVTDAEAFAMARRITREEGILSGGSSGTAAVAAVRVAADVERGSLIVTLFPDGGRSYLSKFYSDSWMSEHGFLEKPTKSARVGEVLSGKSQEIPTLVHVHPHETVNSAIKVMQEFGVSQMPVIRDDDADEPGAILGAIRERDLLEVVLREADAFDREVVDVMQPPMPMVDVNEDIDSLVGTISSNPAIIAIDAGKPVGVITRSDLLDFFSRNQA
jgi:cystathionine beta-synthase